MPSKVKKYRHSATFYRKVRNHINELNSNKVNCDINEVSTCNNNPVMASVENREVEFDNIDLQNSLPFCFGDIPEQDIIEDDESDEEILSDNMPTIEDQLRTWAISNNISHTGINGILKIFNSNNLPVMLPQDSRTLLRTPRSIEIQKIGSGEFWYAGLEIYLRQIYKTLNKATQINLIFNIDGLPIFKSSAIEFWPILCAFYGKPKLAPFAIAIYCGQGKPPLELFLTEFVNEVKNVLNHGIEINGCLLTIRIKCFICDTPARNYILGTVSFNAFHGCLKCTVVGEFDKGGRHMSFPRIDCRLRTDSDFRNMVDSDHHKYETPLISLPINMIEDVIVADSLHLIDLGVTRKCLYGWSNGSYNFRTKWSGHQIEEISNLLLACNSFKPAEMHRSFRKLKELKFWKGVEYRTFLLYLSPLVLKEFLTDDVYNHFLTYFCAVTIISCEEYFKYIDIAETLFKDYINNYIKIYGRDSVSINVHNLCHIINDVKKFGHLPLISSYQFENFLGKIKRLLRGGNRPLTQIAKRITELNCNTKEIQNSPPIATYINLKKIQFSDAFILTTDSKNKWFLTHSNEIVSMIRTNLVNGEIEIIGSIIKEKYDFFKNPLRSSYLNIFASNGEQFELKSFTINNIKCKLFCLERKSEKIFLPILHTLDEMSSIHCRK